MRYIDMTVFPSFRFCKSKSHLLCVLLDRIAGSQSCGRQCEGARWDPWTGVHIIWFGMSERCKLRMWWMLRHKNRFTDGIGTMAKTSQTNPKSSMWMYSDNSELDIYEYPSISGYFELEFSFIHIPSQNGFWQSHIDDLTPSHRLDDVYKKWSKRSWVLQGFNSSSCLPGS